MVSNLTSHGVEKKLYCTLSQIPLFFLLFQTPKKNFADLQKALDELTKLSVATVVRRMLDYAARPLSDSISMRR